MTKIGICLLATFGAASVAHARNPAPSLADILSSSNVVNRAGLGHDVDTTEAGVYYIIHEAGQGALAAPYDTLVIAYEGYLTNGTLFDASQNWAPDGKWEFVYMEQALIEGFNDALSVMNKGSEVEFLIPSSLAYGAYGSPPNIGPYETLVFGVKMHDIKVPK